MYAGDAVPGRCWAPVNPWWAHYIATRCWGKAHRLLGRDERNARVITQNNHKGLENILCIKQKDHTQSTLQGGATSRANYRGVCSYHSWKLMRSSHRATKHRLSISGPSLTAWPSAESQNDLTKQHIQPPLCLTRSLSYSISLQRNPYKLLKTFFLWPFQLKREREPPIHTTHDQCGAL